MLKNLTPINLTLLSMPCHRSEAKEWISRVKEQHLASLAISPEGKSLWREKQAALTDRTDRCASGIQYNSSQKGLKWDNLLI